MVHPPHASPSSLSDSDVEQFRSLLQRHGGVELPQAQARVLADQLLNVLALARDVAIGEASELAVDNGSCQDGQHPQLIAIRKP